MSQTLLLVHRNLNNLFTFKVAEHTFQVPMTRSPLPFDYLCLNTHFLLESRSTTEGFAKVCAVTMVFSKCGV